MKMRSIPVLYLMYNAAAGMAVATQLQLPLRPGLADMPGGSIVALCPESKDSDILRIERIVNRPQTPYLNEEQDVFIWGNFTRNISVNSTVDYQINATANTGDFGALNGTFHICDYLEKLQQPPDSKKVDKVCPPSEGPAFINYAAWFADFLVAPGQWSVKFDAKTPEGDRIYCLQTEFDLQCPPWHDGPECLRDESNPVDISETLRKVKDRKASGETGSMPRPLVA